MMKLKYFEFDFSDIVLFITIVLTIITVILTVFLSVNADKSPSNQGDRTCTLMLVPAGKSFVSVPVCHNKDKP